MQTQNENLNEEQQAIALLKSLLQKKDADEIREDLNKIFYGYVSSEVSDHHKERNFTCSTYLDLVAFFTKISNLSRINRWTN